MKNRFNFYIVRSVAAVALLLLMPTMVQAQIVEYDEAREIEEAEMGVERVARNFMKDYISRASSDRDERWVQIDLGSERDIDAIKILPASNIWGERRGGFPSHFRIEVSNDPAFGEFVTYEDMTLADGYPDPGDKVVTFASKTVRGRYVRFTAARLRDSKLCLTKIMVMHDGEDIAVGCPVTESNPQADSHPEMLTRQHRPQGEFVVTDNPANVIPEKKWKPVKNVAETPLKGVKMNDGLLKTVMENNINYLLNSFTEEQIVRNFKVKGGLPVNPFDWSLSPFWFRELPGSEAGRFLMGAGNTLRWMENAALRKEMDNIVDVIDRCKEPDGYLMAFPKHRMFFGENGAYVRSWVTHGLIDAGYAGNAKAFPLLRGFYDWFDRCAFLPEMLRRPGQGVQGTIPLTRTYFSPVGKPDDIKVVMRYFQENYFMEGLAQRNPEVIYKYPYDRPHNYLLTSIEPYFDLYRATGEKKYLDAVEGAWDLFHDNWEMTGGEMSINEGTFVYEPRSYYLHQEAGELCGNAFWIKLNQRFHNLRPEEEKYQAEIEKSIYNVAIANQYGAEGIRYFAKLDGRKYHPHVAGTFHAMNTCCEGQGTRIYGSLPEYIFSIAREGVYINQYAAAEAELPVGKKSLKLKMDTEFPYGMEVAIAVENTEAVAADIHLRIPSWAAHAVAVAVNGSIEATGEPGTYLSLRRQWKAGDKITFVLPAAFRVTKYEGKERGFEQGHYALEYGPILMAAVGVKGKKQIEIAAGAQTIVARLSPIEGQPLHFAIEGDQQIELWPYFEVGDQPFSCFPKLSEE
ncbi:MAG: glycoside hydrolase family 127 protein [Prevotella sp.]|nr:glycoside hydrolase family 127 protein [Prevotella sp.]